MSQNKENLSAEAPTIIKQIRWFQLHWKEYRKLTAVAVAIIFFVPVYTFSVYFYEQTKKSTSWLSPVNAEIQTEFKAYEKQRRALGRSYQFFKMNGPLRYRVWLGEAEKGNTMAQVLVGRVLSSGMGIAENKTEAAKWYQRAADQGNAAGQFNYGMSHDFGEGVPENKVTAALFYSAAEKQSHPGAITRIGDFYRWGLGEQSRSEKIAVTWYQRAIDLGDSNAMKAAADIYVTGAQGVPVDRTKAILLYKQAATAGNETAKGALAAQTIGAAFETYTRDNATTADRARALKNALVAVGELGSIRAEGLVLALIDFDVQRAVDRLNKMDPADPMRVMNYTLISRLITEFRTSNLATRTWLLANFNIIVADTVQNLEETGEYQRVADICKDTYEGINIADQTSGERDRMVKLLTMCVTSLYVTGYRSEATKLADESFSLIDKILLEKPWDWYLKDGERRLGWKVGKSLIELGDQKKSQVYLQRAWYNVFKMFGRDDLIGKYSILPIKGAVPTDVSAEDKVFFESFAKSAKGNGSMKRFTIPVDFDGTIFPFDVYIVSGKQGYKELQDQFVWVKEYRGGQVSKDFENNFHKINRIATENNVDFLDLYVYASGRALETKNKTH